MKDVLIFNVDHQQFALDLAHLERVICAVEITPIPNEGEGVAGVINVHGTIIPVLNVRKILGREEREIALNDKLISCRIHERRFALWVDDVKGIASYEDKNFIPASEVFPEEHMIDHVIKNEQGIILVYNWGKLLTMLDKTHALKGCAT